MLSSAVWTVTPSVSVSAYALSSPNTPAPHARAHQRMAEPAAFLVGPVDQLQRRLGDDAEVVQAVHHLQAGQHAERAVEFSPAWLAVEMAAEQHRQAVRIATGAAGEHVADGIDAHGQPGGLAFGAEAVAAALVHVGQGEAADASLWAWRRSGPWSSGCPTAVCRRCADWSGRTCRFPGCTGASCPADGSLQDSSPGRGRGHGSE